MALTGLALLLALFAGSRTAAAQAPLKPQIHLQAVGIGLTPLRTAIENGLSGKYGIEAGTFTSQSLTLVQQMVKA